MKIGCFYGNVYGFQGNLYKICQIQFAVEMAFSRTFTKIQGIYHMACHMSQHAN